MKLSMSHDLLRYNTSLPVFALDLTNYKECVQCCVDIIRVYEKRKYSS